MKHKPSLWAFVLQSERSDEEHFTDAVSNRPPSFEDTQSPDNKGDHVTTPRGHVTGGLGYHVTHRNPLYSGAEHTCLWELSQVLYAMCMCTQVQFVVCTHQRKFSPRNFGPHLWLSANNDLWKFYPWNHHFLLIYTHFILSNAYGYAWGLISSGCRHCLRLKPVEIELLVTSMYTAHH